MRPPEAGPGTGDYPEGGHGSLVAGNRRQCTTPLAPKRATIQALGQHSARRCAPPAPYHKPIRPHLSQNAQLPRKVPELALRPHAAEIRWATGRCGTLAVGEAADHALLRRAGLPDVPCHALRHTAAPRLIAQGVHPQVMQERLGHGSAATTLDRYGHLLLGLGREAAARLDALLA